MAKRRIENILSFTEKNKKIQDTIRNLIETEFPIESTNKVLEVSNVYVDDPHETIDLPSQKEIKLNRKSLEVPIYGKITLKDKNTGEVIDSKDKFKIARIPKLTNRFSTIVDGNEYQTVNQFRLKPGVYTRVKNNGDIESRFNLEKG